MENKTHTIIESILIYSSFHNNGWKKKLDETDKGTYNTNNFVVLSADYKKMLLGKIQLTNEKQ